MQVLTSSAILLALWLSYNLIRGLRSPLSSVPGPWYTKWTSLILTYQWLCGRRAQYVQELHEQYGNVVRLSPHIVDFSSITAAKRIHAFTRPLLKAKMYDIFKNSNGARSTFDVREPEAHARHRRLLTSAMSEASLKTVESVVHELAALAVRRIGEETKKDGSANVMKWWMFFSTDVIGELTFGDSFRMLEQGKMNQYTRDLHNLAEASGLRIAFPRFTTLLSYIPLPLFTAAFDSVGRMRYYAEDSIRRYEKSVAADPHNVKTTLFTKTFNAKEETMSQTEIVANAQAYIVAGSDTTAHSMTYLTWAVCRDATIKAKLVEELQGLHDGYQDENLKALPYLNMVVQETLRCYAAAPAGLPRDVPTNGCEIDGYWMPGRTEVTTQAYSMHRNSAVYPEPESFNPLRWESPTKEMKEAWMPFGGGARICIGLHLAQMELRIATAAFFRTYPNAKVSSLDGFSDDDMEQVIYFLMYPKSKRCLIEAS